MSVDLNAQHVAQLEEENALLKAQVGGADLKAFEAIRELRASNKTLTDEVKRLSGEGVQLAFKNRQLEQLARKLHQESQEALAKLQRESSQNLESLRQETDATIARLRQELDQARGRAESLDHSVEELKGELHQSREQVVGHEAELVRQKAELLERQQRLSHLQEDLNLRETRIAKLEQMVNDFKEQFLSGEQFEMAAPTSQEAGGAYQVLMAHVDLALGLPGRTLVDQVYDLLDLSKNCQDLNRLEELFDTLQDTGTAFFTETQEQSALRTALQDAWKEIGGGERSGTAPSGSLGDLESLLDLSASTPLPQAEEAAAAPVGSAAAPVGSAAAPFGSAAAPFGGAAAPFGGAALPIAEVVPEPMVVEEDLVFDDLELLLDPEEEMIEVAHVTVEIEPEALDAPMVAVVSSVAEAEWVAPAPRQKYQDIQEALQQVASQPGEALSLLEQALAQPTWVENQAKGYLALARLKANQDDILPSLCEAMLGCDVSDLFPLLSAAESTAMGEVADRLALLYQFGMNPRSDMAKVEGQAGLGKRSLNRDFVSKIGTPAETQVVKFLRDQLLPRAELNLPVPSQHFNQRLEFTGPAAFVGTLRQALRAVDYTLFDFPELRVLTYDGPEQFIVDAASQPDLTLVFHRDIEGMPPEELCFMVFRHLVRMYRGHSHLAHQASALQDQHRFDLAQAAAQLYLEEASVPHPSLMDRLQALEVGHPDFTEECQRVLLDWYQASNWEGFLYTREFAFGDEVFHKRLDPVADQAAARLVGITAATFGCLREALVSQPDLVNDLQEGLNGLFEESPLASAARLRVQRMWSQFLLPGH